MIRTGEFPSLPATNANVVCADIMLDQESGAHRASATSISRMYWNIYRTRTPSETPGFFALRTFV